MGIPLSSDNPNYFSISWNHIFEQRSLPCSQNHIIIINHISLLHIHIKQFFIFWAEAFFFYTIFINIFINFFPHATLYLYSLSSLINLFVISSLLRGETSYALVVSKLKLLSVSSCRDVLLVAILVEHKDSISNFSFSCCSMCRFKLSFRITRKQFLHVIFLSRPMFLTEHTI